MPDVSIIIPCYNGAWCVDTLAANLRKTAPEHAEIVFVDDGSTDGSLSMFQEQIPEARCFRQENAGLGATRNRAVREAKGEYLQLLDADDTLLPGKIEAQLQFARENGVDVVYSDWRMIVKNGDTVVEEPFVDSATDTEPVEALLGGWWFPPNAALVKKTAYSAVEGCDPSLGNTCEDFDLWVRLAISGARYRHLPGKFANYHRFEDRKSMSRVDRREFFDGEATIINKAIAILEEKGELTEARSRAAARRMHRVARNVFRIDRSWYESMMERVFELDPKFRPEGSILYRSCASVLGLDRAESIALLLKGNQGSQQ